MTEEVYPHAYSNVEGENSMVISFIFQPAPIVLKIPIWMNKVSTYFEVT